jgi:hypothetical protein
MSITMEKSEYKFWSVVRDLSRGLTVPNREVRGGAGDGFRTRYLDLGKVALYQVSYSRSARGSILPGPAQPAV